jgi:hypothetical protein
VPAPPASVPTTPKDCVYVFRSPILEKDMILTKEQALLAVYAAAHEVTQVTVKWTELTYNDFSRELPNDLNLDDLTLLMIE